jgi:hypothetical protein
VDQPRTGRRHRHNQIGDVAGVDLRPLDEGSGCARLIHSVDVSPYIEPVRAAAPITVDVVRDAWDWVMIAGGVASLVTGLVALWLAYRSHQKAEEALKHAADSEARAIERAAWERRALFDLEILRDLLEALDIPDPTGVWGYVAGRPAHDMPLRFGSRLALLPADDLPFWRGSGSMTEDERYALLKIPDAAVLEARNTRMPVPYNLPAGYLRAFMDRLRDDVIEAVQKRMVPVDRPVGQAQAPKLARAPQPVLTT